MKKFYVSLVKDLIGNYIEFDAESRLAVRQYLKKEYSYNNIWTLPWCEVYTEEEMEKLKTKFQCYIIKQNWTGRLKEEEDEPRTS